MAWHEVQAQWRRDARVVLGEPIERSGGPDPAAIMERQVELATAIRGLEALTATDREAIVTSLDDALSGEPLAGREKMRRYRARRRLAALIADLDRPFNPPAEPILQPDDRKTSST